MVIGPSVERPSLGQLRIWVNIGFGLACFGLVRLRCFAAKFALSQVSRDAVVRVQNLSLSMPDFNLVHVRLMLDLGLSCSSACFRGWPRHTFRTYDQSCPTCKLCLCFTSAPRDPNKRSTTRKTLTIALCTSLYFLWPSSYMQHAWKFHVVFLTMPKACLQERR